jgi:UDP-3-O-[3-hydroxymyristoyl] N-acetylglucosamine deacetylase
MVLRPAPENTGIVFVVQNEVGHTFLKPRHDNVSAAVLATTISGNGAHISTVEHLLAAIRGIGIDNIFVEINGNEVPVLDGSAAGFVTMMKKAGLSAQNDPVRYYSVTQAMEFQDGDKYIRVEPYEGFAVDYSIDFAHPAVGAQRMVFDFERNDFAAMIAPSRTFGFLRDVEMLKQNGLALGGSLENAVVLGEKSVVNPEGFRFSDECVRHKILDFIGDMAVSPLPLLGKFTVRRSGHAFNNAFLRNLIEHEQTHLAVTTRKSVPVEQVPAKLSRKPRRSLSLEAAYRAAV